MTTRTITAECDSCESSFEVFYMEELTSEDLPEFCPFCGEHIEKKPQTMRNTMTKMINGNKLDTQGQRFYRRFNW
jgi:hypothetical protein